MSYRSLHYGYCWKIFLIFFEKIQIIWKSSPLKQFDLFEPNLTWVVILKVCPFRIASDDRANRPTILNKMQYAHSFFHLGVHVPFYLHCWGYIQIFGGARSYNMLFFVNITQSWRKPFFFCLTHGLCVCPTIFL